MTDPDLVAKKLGQIESYVREIRTLGKPEAVHSDVRERRFLEHTLQLAIQAALDVASHIESDEALGEPTTNRELFDMLARAGWLTEALTNELGNMAGFRNILVHGYDEVDVRILEDVVRNHLDDLLEFCRLVRARVT